MAQNKVMKLWTAIVTAFLALCTALGLITTTAAAAVPQTEPTRNSKAQETAPPPAPWAYTRALPPTMKQRIRAEAHGKTPTCRHRILADANAAAPAGEPCADPYTAPVEPAIPLLRLLS
ncbi:DUF6344 domain-containing protein [Streptomyces sp. NPDC002838]|uniref:DUF6344 domain-containing protein n=1 Tax=Streptomyces sp. NPDC002838 TaxID=3154436 RepID=UPI00331922F0